MRARAKERLSVAALWVGLACFFTTGLGRAAAAAEPTAWIEMVQGGGAEVRAAVDMGPCPPVVADGRSIAMSIRAGPNLAFPNRLCQALLPKGVRHAEVMGRSLPAPRPRFDRIVIIGDTGCRLKGLLVQNCNDPEAWPFALVARLAASERPDLVIHVGDYYYRESACPLNWSGCAGSPHGDAWPTWVAEFFDPARPLLDAAPWVFARGNHESCSRGGKGWFRLLDAADEVTPCPALSAPFAVPLGEVTLHVLDSADTVDRGRPPAAVDAFRQGLLTAQPDGSASQWIITHRPIWGLVPIARVGSFGPLNLPINLTEQAAAKGLKLSDVQLILSGHIHHFGSFSFGPARPAQLIVGTGGDVGESADIPTLRSDVVAIDGLQAKSLEFDQFGYFVMERSGSQWLGTFKDVHGRILTRCLLRGRALDCTK